MKKLFLNLEEGSGEILTREELKKVLGGFYHGSGGKYCSGTSRETCSGTCEVDGYKGFCMWVSIQSTCACATAYGGS